MLRRVCLGLGQKCRDLHTVSHDAPTDTLRRKVYEFEKKRKKRSLQKNKLYVDVPESKTYLDTASMPMILVAVGTCIFAKILMMIDESKEQERLERKMKKAPPEQGTVRMLTREEWDNIQEVRPRTPFESNLARPSARLRNGEPLRLEDLKDWTLDVLTDAFTRAEEAARGGSR